MSILGYLMRKEAVSGHRLTVPQSRSGKKSIGVAKLLEKDKNGTLYKKQDLLHGGRADHVANKAFPAAALEEGIKHEHEHTSSRAVAAEVAKDHLAEDPKYYKNLEKMERDSKLASAALFLKKVADSSGSLALTPGLGGGDSLNSQIQSVFKPQGLALPSPYKSGDSPTVDTDAVNPKVERHENNMSVGPAAKVAADKALEKLELPDADREDQPQGGTATVVSKNRAETSDQPTGNWVPLTGM
jgi:hypothetical protein